MTTELAAAAAEYTGEPTLGEQFSYLCTLNEDLYRRCDRLRKENDELRQLIIEMRRRVADIMHSSIDDFK